MGRGTAGEHSHTERGERVDKTLITTLLVFEPETSCTEFKNSYVGVSARRRSY